MTVTDLLHRLGSSESPGADPSEDGPYWQFEIHEEQSVHGDNWLEATITVVAPNLHALTVAAARAVQELDRAPS